MRTGLTCTLNVGLLRLSHVSNALLIGFKSTGSKKAPVGNEPYTIRIKTTESSVTLVHADTSTVYGPFTVTNDEFVVPDALPLGKYSTPNHSNVIEIISQGEAWMWADNTGVMWADTTGTLIKES